MRSASRTLAKEKGVFTRIGSKAWSLAESFEAEISC